MSANSYTGVVTVPVRGTSDDNLPKLEQPQQQQQQQNQNNNDSAHPRGRSKIVISIFEKLNMLFLLFLVCYLSWTIPANYGLFSRGGGGRGGEAVHKNSSLQGSTKVETDERNGTETWLSSLEVNSTEFKKRLFSKLELSKLGKQYSSKWRKKNRDPSRSDIHDNSVDSFSGSKNKTVLSKNKKRKHKKTRRRNRKKNKLRKKKLKNRLENRLKPTTIRHIIEKVAEEALTRTSGSWDYSDIPRREDPNMVTVSDNSLDNTVHVLPTRTYDIASDMWSPWGECSVTCGLGQRERMRSCGATCKELETMVCYAPACSGRDRDLPPENDFFFLGRHERPRFQETDYVDPEVDACSKWMECNKDAINKYLNQSDLPSCPCSLPLHLGYNEKVWDHDRQMHFRWVEIDKVAEAIQAYHPGAATCIRSKLRPGAETLAAQTCCYDNTLELITRGKGAGTPNLVSPEMSPELHDKLDVNPWIICKGDWTRYNTVLPPDNGRQCTDKPDNKTIELQIKAAQNY